MNAIAIQNPPEKHWERAIVSIKMNTFFSSIEQCDNPALRNRPVGIINDTKGKLIFCCSDEADRLGIRKGMKINDAKRLAPDFILTAARYERYDEVAQNITTALSKITSDIEVNSINQIYMDITNIQHTLGRPETIVEFISDAIQQTYPGISTTIGVAGDKTTAAYAASTKRASGTVVIPPCLSAQRLSNVPLSRLDGVSRSTALFLARRGIRRCADMKNVEIETLAKHFGNEGTKLWYMAQGLDPTPIRVKNSKRQTITQAKILETFHPQTDMFNTVKPTSVSCGSD